MDSKFAYRCALSTTVMDRGRAQGLPLCAPPAVSRICHACYALDNRHGQQRPGRPARIATALRDNPLRTPCGVGK
eukprot:7877890-Pyramimonas_sp.AAC.1